jgi:hypothetical protein
MDGCFWRLVMLAMQNLAQFLGNCDVYVYI